MIFISRFPLRYVSTLLGIMWTIAGMVSFVCYGLTRFAVDPINAWRVGEMEMRTPMQSSL